jgi:hypothetical protein
MVRESVLPHGGELALQLNRSFKLAEKLNNYLNI